MRGVIAGILITIAFDVARIAKALEVLAGLR